MPRFRLPVSTRRHKSLSCRLPLRTREKPVGVVFVSADRAGAYGESHREIAAVLAGQGMIAYENAMLFARVEQLALTDGLTGLFNRRHFFHLADREIGLFTQLVAPMTRQQGPAGRAKAADTVSELASLTQRVHAALVRAGLRETLGR